jgi:hypothetical protein
VGGVVKDKVDATASLTSNTRRRQVARSHEMTVQLNLTSEADQY